MPKVFWKLLWLPEKSENDFQVATMHLCSYWRMTHGQRECLKSYVLVQWHLKVPAGASHSKLGCQHPASSKLWINTLKGTCHTIRHSIYVSTTLKIISVLSSGMCSQGSSMCMSVHYTSSKWISSFESWKEDHNISQHSKSLRPWLKSSKVSISGCTLGGNQVWIVIVCQNEKEGAFKRQSSQYVENVEFPISTNWNLLIPTSSSLAALTMSMTWHKSGKVSKNPFSMIQSGVRSKGIWWHCHSLPFLCPESFGNAPWPT